MQVGKGKNMFKFLLAQTEIFSHFLSGGPGKAGAAAATAADAKKCVLSPCLHPTSAIASAAAQLAPFTIPRLCLEQGWAQAGWTRNEH